MQDKVSFNSFYLLMSCNCRLKSKVSFVVGRRSRDLPNEKGSSFCVLR